MNIHAGQKFRSFCHSRKALDLLDQIRRSQHSISFLETLEIYRMKTGLRTVPPARDMGYYLGFLYGVLLPCKEDGIVLGLLSGAFPCQNNIFLNLLISDAGTGKGRTEALFQRDGISIRFFAGNIQIYR